MQRETKVYIFTLFLIIMTTASLHAKLTPKDDIPKDMPAVVKTQVERFYATDNNERIAAAKQLKELGDEALTAVPYLIMMLDDENMIVRREIVYTLRALKAVSALKPLKEVMENDPVDAVKRAARMAIDAINEAEK